ncbi:unnamed protein product [Parnassius mnemosyne]|uniref:Endonuclease/exonuclease/phosphatase domain-containing protein n=1 Tax=Parnassius mnemosyne TaxID=213953 RepID=A0AAV1LGU2_9NEOP
MAIGTAYRPEYVSVQETLDALSETMNSMARCDITCILGDFNIDMACISSSKVKELKHFCYHYSLQQLVKEPTRITDHSQTIIDLVMTDSPLKCKYIDVIHNHCLSDHALVIVDLDIKKPNLNKEVRIQRPLYYINQDKFTEDLKLIPWESIYNLHNVDEMVKTFNMYIIKLFDIHAPICKVVLKDKPKPWITNMVKFMMKLRDKALTKAQKDKKDSSKDYYQNFVTATIEIERKAYYNNFVNNNMKNPTLLWKNIKNSTQFDYMHKPIIPEHLNDPNKINDHFLNLPVSNISNSSKLNINQHC